MNVWSWQNFKDISAFYKSRNAGEVGIPAFPTTCRCWSPYRRRSSVIGETAVPMHARIKKFCCIWRMRR